MTTRFSRLVPPSRAAAHDRWIVSYADFMTLLFAFVTVAYAMPLVPAIDAPSAMERSGPPDAPAHIDTLHVQFERLLQDAVADQRVDIVRDARGVVLSLPDAATFATGSADVRPDAAALIAQIAAVVTPLPFMLRVEGHTDDVPIRTATFASNWELSTARASAVVAMLITDHAIAPERLSAAGYGEFRPRVANDSEANRARNRRVDIVVTR